MANRLAGKEYRLPNIFSFYPTSLLALVFCILSLVLTYYTYQSLKQSQQADDQRYQVYLLATQLNQSSDQLSLMARSYAVTGDVKYFTFYNEIINIRVGKQFRPQFYHRVYWDLLMPENGIAPFPIDKKKSYKELMKSLNLSENEIALLLQAKSASNQLSVTETLAFEAVEEGLSSNVNYQQSDARARAISLLYNNDYLLEKSKIKQLINDFFDQHEPRALKEIQSKSTSHYVFATLTTISFLISISFLLYSLNVQSKSKALFVKTLRSEVANRTLELFEKRELLKVALNEMEETKHQLAENEKMASLGNLVGGVAHEVNTPLGISVTLGSFLQDGIKLLQKNIESGNLKRSDLDNYCTESLESCELLLSNLDRAANLISSFKQVAVDQSSGEMRSFKLSEYTDEVLVSLRPFIKKSNIEVEVHAPINEPTLNSCPGSIAQIITNLVMNAVIHGFNNGKNNGKIDFIFVAKKDSMLMTVCDDGVGMPDEVTHKIFEPFYTTKRGNGGSGLGMSIVYNLVVHQLQGSIKCQSELGHGTRFTICLPMENEKAEKWHCSI